MPSFDINLSECFGFSQIMISELLRTSIARIVMSSKLPIGVATIYSPFLIYLILLIFLFLSSCSPPNNIIVNKKTTSTEVEKNHYEIDEIKNNNLNSTKEKDNITDLDFEIINNITIILSKKDDQKIVDQFIKVVELAVYNKKLKNISFEINIYEDKLNLDKYLKSEDLAGRIFIGPLNSYDSQIIKKYCSKGAIFFSFSSDKNLANDCVYLVNFFPDNELRALFNFFPNNSKVALLYPENAYGFGINMIIDDIANNSNSVIVNRSSYNPSLSNAPQSIKELGKYELRKYELNRQKKILASQKNEKSKKRLIKLEKFQTTQDLHFTHVIIADYGLRLLQVAPLLAYYDIDPNIVQFVGTGAWDDQVFFEEPTLNHSIYPGVEFKKREDLFNDYYNLYNENLLRVSTLPYDLTALLSFIINNDLTINNTINLLNDSKTKFSGIDGNFNFLNNSIERELSILKITEGKSVVISK